MKKTNLILSIASIFLVGALSSCSNTNDPNTLNIICLNASYGDQWINTLKDKFENDNPGIKINLKTSYDANKLIESHLSSSKNTDDLYISVGTSWKVNAAQNYFEELDSLLDETVDNVTLKEKVADEYKNSLYFTKSDGSKHCYRLPWTSGIGGIYYNNAMFKKYGWSDWLKKTYPTNTSGTPETFEQLKALCKKINDSKIVAPGSDGDVAIKPFVYTGANNDYFDYLTLSWWGQLAGVDAIQEFLKYESVDNYDVAKNQTYNYLKQATSYWNQIFGDSANVVEGCESKTAANAQKEFINGMAAMIVDGDWLYNDYLAGFNKSDSFELKLMKTPLLENATHPNTSYIIGEDQYIAIPKTAPHKDLAKSFIKLIVSDEGCNTFLKDAHGFLAYNCDYSTEGLNDEYISSAIEVRKSYTNTYTNFSNNRKYLCNYIDIWCTSALRPYSFLLNGSQSIDQVFQNIYSTAKQGWELWTNNSN